jgi:molecular chaperone DnaK (HSP70)
LLSCALWRNNPVPCAALQHEKVGKFPISQKKKRRLLLASHDANPCPVLQIAKRQAVVNPENTFFSVKRFIGSKFKEVKTESTQVPYRVKEDEAGNVKVVSSFAKKDFAPEEISAQVLRKLVDDAGKFPLLQSWRGATLLQQLLHHLLDRSQMNY